MQSAAKRVKTCSPTELCASKFFNNLWFLDVISLPLPLIKNMNINNIEIIRTFEVYSENSVDRVTTFNAARTIYRRRAEHNFSYMIERNMLKYMDHLISVLKLHTLYNYDSKLFISYSDVKSAMLIADNLLNATNNVEYTPVVETTIRDITDDDVLCMYMVTNESYGIDRAFFTLEEAFTYRNALKKLVAADITKLIRLKGSCKTLLPLDNVSHINHNGMYYMMRHINNSPEALKIV